MPAFGSMWTAWCWWGGRRLHSRKDIKLQSLHVIGKVGMFWPEADLCVCDFWFYFYVHAGLGDLFFSGASQICHFNYYKNKNKNKSNPHSGDFQS